MNEQELSIPIRQTPLQMQSFIYGAFLVYQQVGRWVDSNGKTPEGPDLRYG